MATSVSLPPNSHIPVTPPPDHPTFIKTEAAASPHVLKTFAQEAYGNMGAKLQAQAPAATSTSTTTAAAPAADGLQTPPLDPNGAPLDPRYLTMVSRIAAYYQQRCQAVANYQQQRCQAWANMHRQKCQEMMQAAMLVVAWYIRDRIQRRRRKQRRSFRKGLSERVPRSKVTKGERVRRWVMNVPQTALLPHSAFRDGLNDKEEADFDIDRENTPDKDAKLFNVADNLIKSQLSRIDVPLMGALSFDESDSESEAEEEEEEIEEEDYEEEGGDDELLDEEEYYDDDDDDDDDEMEELEDDSELVHPATGDGSHKQNNSSSLD